MLAAVYDISFIWWMKGCGVSYSQRSACVIMSSAHLKITFVKTLAASTLDIGHLVTVIVRILRDVLAASQRSVFDRSLAQASV